MFEGLMYPRNTEAEAYVLGSFMIDSMGESEGLLGKTDLIAEDFFLKTNQDIFMAMKKLRESGEPIDLVSVSNIVGPSIAMTLSNYMKEIPTTANIDNHAGLVKEASRKRDLLRACLTAAQEINNAPLEDLLSSLRKSISSVVTGNGGNIVTMSDIATEIDSFLEKRHKSSGILSGIPTGFIDLDNQMDGLQPGDFIVLAARPGMGKTILSSTIAENSGVPVGIVSLEMGKRQLGLRTLAKLTQIELNTLQQGRVKKEEWTKISKNVAKMAEMPIYFSFSSHKPSSIEKAVSQMVEKYGIKLLIFDYIQLGSSDTQRKREQEVSEISRLLKGIALRYEMPVIGLSQLNREVERREGKRPMLADLRESGAIEQDADIVMFLYRENLADLRGVVEVIFGKGRNITTGIVKLWFDGPTMTFSNYIEPPKEII